VTKEEVPILESWKRLSCIKLPPSEELNRLQPPQLIMETPSVRLSLSLSPGLTKTKKTQLFLSLFFEHTTVSLCGLWLAKDKNTQPCEALLQ